MSTFFLFFALATSVFNWYYEVVVVQKLYVWFAVPYGAPELPFAAVFGLVLLMSAVTMRVPQYAEDNRTAEQKAIGAAGSTLSVTLALGLLHFMGYIASTYMP